MRTLLIVAAMLPLAGSAAAQSPSEIALANQIYRVGTDAGMLYLSQHSARLRITLIAQECGHGEIASRLGRGLPDSTEFFFNSGYGSGLAGNDLLAASQITRSYVLGYEVGIRTEHQLQPGYWAEERCTVNALAAIQIEGMQ